ncbi:MAG: hypothetical protein M1546_25975 [Chloroflexi bacterium]|nr:hypothetical protein [Chloroflexota bacterium]
MKIKPFFLISLAATSLLAASSISVAGHADTNESLPGTSFAAEVRRATAPYQDLAAAKAARYALFHGCVSGPEQGAMGVHFVNGDLVGDAELDLLKPEALIYELRNGRTQLVGVEYVVFAEAWNASNMTPPMLKGQLFTYTGSPNRYGIPAFYALHAWVWKSNPAGMFADWNSRVTCEEYTGEDLTQTQGPTHTSYH